MGCRKALSNVNKVSSAQLVFGKEQKSEFKHNFIGLNTPSPLWIHPLGWDRFWENICQSFKYPINFTGLTKCALNSSWKSYRVILPEFFLQFLGENRLKKLHFLRKNTTLRSNEWLVWTLTQKNNIKTNHTFGKNIQQIIVLNKGKPNRS